MQGLAGTADRKQSTAAVYDLENIPPELECQASCGEGEWTRTLQLDQQGELVDTSMYALLILLLF